MLISRISCLSCYFVFVAQGLSRPGLIFAAHSFRPPQHVREPAPALGLHQPPGVVLHGARLWQAGETALGLCSQTLWRAGSERKREGSCRATGRATDMTGWARANGGRGVESRGSGR